MSMQAANEARLADPMIGELLGGRYLVERLIGRGGMGLVYLAIEVARERRVVVKMLAPHWADDADSVARFDREGDRLAELRHPNIVELFDVGRAGEQAFIAMEYIDGEPLRRFLGRKKRLSIGDFSPIAAQILDAVAYAHEQKMMLRDIKPSNIMLCEQGGKANFVKLLDFGLAKLVDSDDVEVTRSHVVGTAGYLSPEQIRGDSTDLRVDIYSLGILFFVMLAGKSPIIGDSDAAVLYNHVHGTPLRLADELPEGHEVPDNLIILIHGCLEKDPKRRPSDAGVLAEALRSCLPPHTLVPPDATEETREAIRVYRESKLGIEADPDADVEAEDSSSAEWTRPLDTVPPRRGASPAKTDPARRKLRRAGPRKAVRSTGPREIVRGTGPRQVVRRRTGPHPSLGGGSDMARSDSGPVASAGIERTTPEGSGLAEPVDDVGAVSGPISLVHPHSSHRSLKLSLGLMVAVLVALGLGGAVAYLVFAMK